MLRLSCFPQIFMRRIARRARAPVVMGAYRVVVETGAPCAQRSPVGVSSGVQSDGGYRGG